MIKVLLCLVVSMTLTSGVLSWLDPTLPGAVSKLPSDTIIELAEKAVAQDVVIDDARWGVVEVVAELPRRNQAMLTATADRPAWHFQVSPEGRPVASGNWRYQNDGEHPNVITISLVMSAETPEITAAQAICVKAILATIRQEMPESALRVVSGLPASIFR